MKRLVYVICTIAVVVSVLSCGKKGPPVLKDYGSDRNDRHEKSE